MSVCVFIVVMYAYYLSEVPKKGSKTLTICVFIVITYAYNLSEVPKEEVRVCLCVFIVVLYTYTLSQLPTIIQCAQIGISIIFASTSSLLRNKVGCFIFLLKKTRHIFSNYM